MADGKKQQVKGTAEEIKGKAQQAWGKMTGDRNDRGQGTR